MTALVVCGLVVLLTVKTIAPSLPPMVGRPDVHEVREFTQPEAKRVRLSNSDGLVRITTSPRKDVSGHAEIRAFLRGGESEADLQNYVGSLVHIDEVGDTLVITTEPRERPDGYELFVVYDVRVPQGTDVEIESNNGNVWVESGCGRVQVRGRNTDIEVRRPQGDVIAESVNGRITVHEAPEGGRLKTVNGNVYADIEGGRLEATTANGNVMARLLGPSVAGAALTSQNGGVTLEVDEACSATVQARTARGQVRSEIPLDSAGGTRQRRFLQGTVGEGDPRAMITVDTLNGDISIARSSS